MAGAGTLDPAVSATDDSIMAARHIGTRGGDETATVAAAVSALETFLVIIVRSQCVWRRDGTCICYLQNLLSGCLRGIMKLAVEENIYW